MLSWHSVKLPTLEEKPGGKKQSFLGFGGGFLFLFLFQESLSNWALASSVGGRFPQNVYCKWTLMSGMLLLLSRFSRVRLCDPIDGSPPGSPVPGILQARTLEWVAIFFSNAWKWKVKGKSLSHVRLFATPWTAAHQAPPSMGFSRQECWSGVPSPSPMSGICLLYSCYCFWSLYASELEKPAITFF